MTLADLLGSLNGAIDAWNAKVADAVESGRLSPGDGILNKVQPGLATADFVSRESWPLTFMKAVEYRMIHESPEELAGLVKQVSQPTKIIREIGIGAKTTSQAKMKRVLISVLHYAHLLSHTEQLCRT